ncbi:MAG: hypothetical protein PHX18_02290 [Candidatus Gastranaerophilales bacterium]|nr:hypothetical protein [Candidatus Gastranaerophilales bacterium]
MTDIHNHNINKLNQTGLNFEGIQPKEAKHANQEAAKEIKNLDKAHSALVGRSMVNKTNKLAFDGALAKSVKADLAELNANPQAVAASNAIFEAALKKGYSYEQAASMSRIAFEDFKEKI